MSDIVSGGLDDRLAMQLACCYEAGRSLRLPHLAWEDERVNRTDRLYGLVEELRAASPRPRSARRLADRFEVSVRTIERDLAALQQSGLPIWAEPGRTGGYVIDASATMRPAGFTLDEGDCCRFG